MGIADIFTSRKKLRETTLEDAVKSKDLELAKLHMKNGGVPGADVLKIAVRDLNFEMLQLLVDSAPEVDTTVLDELVPAAAPHAEMMAYLIDHGSGCVAWFPYTYQDDDGEIIYNALSATVRKLGVLDPDQFLDGNSSMRESVLRKFTNCIDLLIEKGVDLNPETPRSPLTAAVTHGLEEIVHLLVERGAELEHFSEPDIPALMTAIINNRPKMVDVLIGLGADVNQRIEFEDEEEGHSVLFPLYLAIGAAVNFGDIHIAEKLLLAGANPNSLLEDGNPILLRVITSDAMDLQTKSGLIDLLIAHGADVDGKGAEGMTALGSALDMQAYDLFEKLLKAGANPNTLSEDGDPILIHIITSEAMDIQTKSKLIDRLIEQKVRVNCTDAKGIPAVVLAFGDERHLIASKLLENGADPRHLNDDARYLLGASVLQSAEAGLGKALVFEWAGEAKYYDYQDTPVDVALRKGKFDLARDFLDKGVQANHWHALDAKALSYLLTYMLDKGSNRKDRFSRSVGASIAYAAVREDLFEIVKRIFARGEGRTYSEHRLSSIFSAVSEKTSPATVNYLLGEELFSTRINTLSLKIADKTHVLELGGGASADALGVTLVYSGESIEALKGAHDLTESLCKALGMEKERCDVQVDEIVIVRILGSSPEAKLLQRLKVRDQRPAFFNFVPRDGTSLLFFKPLDGVSLREWLQEQRFIEDVLGRPVNIEEYDPTHPLYCSEYGKERLILIRESNISALTKELGLTGSFLKSSDGMHVFQDVASRDEWQEKLEAIRAFLGTRVSIAEYDAERGHLVLGESIEQTLGKTLGIEDNGRASELLYTQALSHGKHCYFYSEVDGLDNLGEWKRSLKKIRRLLNSNVLIGETDNHDRSIPVDADRLIALREVDYIPEPSQMKALEILQRLEKGKLYWGEGIEGAYLTDISDASHMLIMGESGSGKSNFMNGLILSLLHSIETIEHIYMVDFKGGVELHEYADLIPQKIEMVDYKHRLLTLLKRIQLEMEARLKYMRAQGIRKITQNPIFLIIDEFADISQMEESTHEERLLKEQILSILRELTRKARATNIKIWAMLQEANAGNMEPSFKNQLQSRVLLKTTEENTARFAISDNHLNEIGLDVARMPRGRIAFVDASQERIKAVELQFPLVDPDDTPPKEKKMYRLELHPEQDKSFSRTIEGYFEDVFRDRPELRPDDPAPSPEAEARPEEDGAANVMTDFQMMDDFDLEDDAEPSDDETMEEVGRMYADMARAMQEYEEEHR